METGVEAEQACESISTTLMMKTIMLSYYTAHRHRIKAKAKRSLYTEPHDVIIIITIIYALRRHVEGIESIVVT